jgi:hypothetical protein
MRALLLFLAVVTIVSCQGTSGSRSPQSEAGLLLGLSSGRTLLFARNGERFELVAERKPLLVPSDSGMYWIGMETRCGVDTSSADFVAEQEWVAQHQVVYVARPGSTTNVLLDGMDCRQAENLVQQLRGKRTHSDSARTAMSQQVGGEGTAELYCSVGTETITFASATLLSYQARNHTTEFCNPAKYTTSGWNIVRHVSDDGRLLLRSAVSPTSWQRIHTQITDTATSCAFDYETDDAALDSTWAVTHAKGTWFVTLWLNGPTVCRGGRDWDFEEVSADSLAGALRLPLAWDSLVGQEPKTLDAASSPSGKFFVLHRPDSLTITPFVAGRIGPALVQVPAKYEEQFVELRWLDSEEIFRLRSGIASLKDPVIVVRPPGRP